MSAAGSPFIASPGRVESSGTSLQTQHQQQDVPEEDATEIDFYVSENSDTLSLSTGCSEDDRKSFVEEDEEKSFVDEDEDETAEIDFYISEKTDVLSLSSDGSAEDDMSIFVDDTEEFPEAVQSKEGGEGSELGNDGEHTSEAQGAPEEGSPDVVTSSMEGRDSEPTKVSELTNDEQESPDYMKSSMQGKGIEPTKDSELTDDEQVPPKQQDLPVIAKASTLTLPESAKPTRDSLPEFATSTKDTLPAPSMASPPELETIKETEETGSRHSNDSNDSDARGTPKELPVIAKASALTLPESAKPTRDSLPEFAVSTKDTFPAPSMASPPELETIKETEETGSRHSNDSNESNARGTPKEGKAWCMVPDSVKKLFKRKSKSPPGSPSSSSSEFPAFEAIVPEQPLGPEPQRSRSGRQQAWASEPDLDRHWQAFNGAAESSARTDEPQEADAPRVQGNQQATGSRSSSSGTFTLPRFGRSRPAQVTPYEE